MAAVRGHHPLMMGSRPGGDGKGKQRAVSGSPLLDDGSVEATVFRAFPDPLKDYEQFTKYVAGFHPCVMYA